MAKYNSPSDYTTLQVDYSPSSGAAYGYYTNSNLVAQLLQVPDFTSSSNPSSTEIGSLIKRTEDFIDEKTGTSWRGLIYRDEYHSFTFTGVHYNMPKYWNDYVGFVQLDRHEIRKILKLEVWQGGGWLDLASATGSVLFSDYTNVTNVTLKLPGKTASSGVGIWELNSGLTTSTFNSTLGNTTAAQELASLINEVFPTDSATVTGATASKAVLDNTNAGSQSISDFFYASVDSEDSTKVVITSLLSGDDGTNCNITITGSGLIKNDFIDQEAQKRLGDWWKINREGRIFFRQNFPYLEYNSVRVSYIAGSRRVPGVITDAATKLVACEILRHDDQTVLISDSGAQIDIKTKHDLLKEDAMQIIEGKKEAIFFIE